MSVLPFSRVCLLAGLPAPVPEYRFCERRWRLDFAWPPQMIALEVNGGVWIRGKHSRGAGQINDFAKWTRAAALGWRLLHCTPDRLESIEMQDALRLAFVTWGKELHITVNSGVRSLDEAIRL